MGESKAMTFMMQTTFSAAMLLQKTPQGMCRSALDTLCNINNHMYHYSFFMWFVINNELDNNSSSYNKLCLLYNPHPSVKF